MLLSCAVLAVGAVTTTAKGKSAAGAGAQTVRCRYQLMNEDHYDALNGSGVCFKYGICESLESADTVYYLPEEGEVKRSSPYKPGEILTLRVEEEPAGAAASRASVSHHTGELIHDSEAPVYALNGAP